MKSEYVENICHVKLFNTFVIQFLKYFTGFVVSILENVYCFTISFVLNPQTLSGSGVNQNRRETLLMVSNTIKSKQWNSALWYNGTYTCNSLMV